MRLFAPALTMALAGVLAAADCGGGEDGPTETPTLTTLSADIFQPRCGNAGCHSSDNPAAGLDLVTDPHASLVGVDSISDPALKLVGAGDPNNSVLLLILEGPVGASRQMPPGVDLPAEDIDAIRAWITAGAAND
jgi:hypothetical protein